MASHAPGVGFDNVSVLKLNLMVTTDTLDPGFVKGADHGERTEHEATTGIWG